MAEQSSPNNSGRLLLAFVFLLITGGWLYFQYVQGGTDDSAIALAAQDEMLARQAEAEEVGAKTLAPDTYDKAIKAKEGGEQELAQGEYTAAEISFITARDFFKIAETESRGAQLGVEEQKERALTAKEKMLDAQSNAEAADAPTRAAAAYQRAVNTAEQADREFANGDYATSEGSYQTAGEHFRTARNEAQRMYMEEEPDLNKIRKGITSLKTQMLEEKNAAEQAGARKLATAQFEEAVKYERDGDESVRTNTRGGYINAQQFYSVAEEGYRKAKEEALEEEKLRKEAEDAMSQMYQKKEEVPAGPAEQERNAAYQQARNQEEIGRQQLREGKFESAGRAFREAGRLYEQAGQEIEALRRQPPEPEPLPPAAPPKLDPEEDPVEMARQEIRELILSYRRSLENRDAGTLARIFKEVGWADSNFLNNVKNVEAVIRNESVEVNGNRARAQFKIDFSYINDRKNKKDSIFKDWELIKVNGQWRIVN